MIARRGAQREAQQPLVCQQPLDADSYGTSKLMSEFGEITGRSHVTSSTSNHVLSLPEVYHFRAVLTTCPFSKMRSWRSARSHCCQALVTMASIEYKYSYPTGAKQGMVAKTDMKAPYDQDPGSADGARAGGFLFHHDHPLAG